MAKKVAVLGSTGSIGCQALDVIRTRGYEVAALCAGRNHELLLQQVAEFKPRVVAIADTGAAVHLHAELAGSSNPPQIFTGPDSAAMAAAVADCDIVLNAVVGIAGLSATMTTLERGIDLALANKESLVTGGALVTKMAEKTGAKLLPVDSEHSAIFQCLQDPYAAQGLRKILLTASGGPFYGEKVGDLASVTAADALAHPNWEMGAKITTDSATMMNKGLELIEAMWLFGLNAGDIEIVVQRESIIHSMVQLADNSILAQLGVPDMRIPIQYALTWPERLPCPAPALDFKTLTGLSFGRADAETFRCLAACKKAAEKGGLAPCAANGANEEAVALFLKGEIGFLEIGRLVEACVDREAYAGGYDLQDVYQCDAAARRFVRENLRKDIG